MPTPPAHRAPALILSCEHAGNRVPARYRGLFSDALLATHRGYDPGALEAARTFAAATRAPLFYGTVTRLLVELNRPLGHAQLFSARSLRLGEVEHETLLARYWRPYWQAVEARVVKGLARGPVLHLSVHSFTPRFKGERRTTDIGLLFDPRHAGETRFCRLWHRLLRRLAPELRVHYNKPYRGTGAALTTSLRETYGARGYLGIEIEINQRFPRGAAARWKSLRRLLAESFARAVGSSWSG